MGKKDEQLGMPFGTATGRLRKLVLFDLLQRFKLNVCIRCSKTIDNINDLSLEHIKPWLDSNDPTEAFFDLKNVAFSHTSCNYGFKRTPNKGVITSKHGSTSRYNHQDCRCKECKKANAIRREQQRQGIKQTGRWG